MDRVFFDQLKLPEARYNVESSNRSLHRKERKAQPHISLNSEEIIRTGTRMTRIGRIYTDQGAQRLKTAPKHGETMIVCLPRNNKPQIKSVYKLFKDAGVTLISTGM